MQSLTIDNLDDARSRRASIVATRLVAENAVDAALRVVKTCRLAGRTASDTTALAAADRAAHPAVVVLAVEAEDAVAALGLIIFCGDNHGRKRWRKIEK